MFKPQYTITNKLLAQIKHINSLVNKLNHQRFPNIVLIELERIAREVSVFASTSIEGNPLPLTQVKKILKSTPTHIRDSEKEVLNYNESLQDLNEKLKKKRLDLSPNLILNIQRQVTKNLLPKHESGYFRKNPVVINDPKTNKVAFLPPDHKDVPSLINKLIEFIKYNQNKIDSLILAGIFHKQLVIIHPFMDGNGRTTRLATKVLLASMGLNTFNLFSFENYYNKNVTKYFQTVGEFGNYYEIKKEINFTPWLEYFTEGIIDELLRVQKLLPQASISPETKLKSHHQAILSFIKENGFIQDKDYAKITNRAKATRALDFQKLISLGMIQREGKGKATYYTHKNS